MYFAASGALSYFVALHGVSAFSINSPGLCDKSAYLCREWKSVQAVGFTPLFCGGGVRMCVCGIEQSFEVNVKSSTPVGKVGRKVSKRVGY